MTKENMLVVGVILASTLPLVSGCRNDERISGYAPQYVFEVEFSDGEEAEFTSEPSTISCSWDRDDNRLQLRFPYEFQAANEGLTYYFPLGETPNLRTASTVEIQTFFMGDNILVLPGYGGGYIASAFGATLSEDPRDEIFSRVSFPLYIYDFYIPPQTVCSLENPSVCRTLMESRVEMAAVWCEDSEATLDNMLSRYALSSAHAFARYKEDRNQLDLRASDTLAFGGVK